MASHSSVHKDLRMMLLGHCGVGKSATVNAILGKETFKETETIRCELQRGRVEERNISLIDTPGINNTSLTTEHWRTELKKGLLLSSPGPHVFLLVTKAGKFSEEEKNAVRWIRENFGEEALKFSMVLFIGREEMTNRQWVTFSEDSRTKDLISSCKGRYCVINSKREANPTQIIKLLEEIETMVLQNGDRFYTQEIYEAIDRIRTTEVTQKGHENLPEPIQGTDLQVQKDDAVIGVNTKCGNVIPPKKQEKSGETLKRQEETWKTREIKKWEKERGARGGVKPHPAMERRIVLLGKTGSGKSAAGNTILKGTYFEVKSSPVLVTKKCELKTSEQVRVIDTPGMFNRLLTPDELQKIMDQCMSMSVPGPHVFLLVVKLGRFTEEEKNTVNWIKENFGEHALRFTIVLFTHTDQLGERTLDDFLAESPDLRELLNSCGNRFHAFNNNDSSPSQVDSLMQKIDNLVMMNERRHYTNEMYQAQRTFSAGEMFALGFTAAAGITATAGLVTLGLLIRK